MAVMRILVPADGSKAALRAVRRACVAHRAQVLYGEPGTTIAAAARRPKCASIVMGARGLGSVEGLLPGPMATKVIHLAKAPLTPIK